MDYVPAHQEAAAAQAKEAMSWRDARCLSASRRVSALRGSAAQVAHSRDPCQLAGRVMEDAWVRAAGIPTVILSGSVGPPWWRPTASGHMRLHG